MRKKIRISESTFFKGISALAHFFNLHIVLEVSHIVLEVSQLNVLAFLIGM